MSEWVQWMVLTRSNSGVMSILFYVFLSNTGIYHHHSENHLSVLFINLHIHFLA